VSVVFNTRIVAGAKDAELFDKPVLSLNGLSMPDRLSYFSFFSIVLGLSKTSAHSSRFPDSNMEE
jgi:hypothetical protein